MRQIVVDTETTGLEVDQGHRIIEIGAVELVNRRIGPRSFHRYLQPDRAIDAEAQAVHGIDADFLANQPRFADVVDEWLDFLGDDELIIHNAPFDLGFLDRELERADREAWRLQGRLSVIDSLVLARRRHPGQKNNLDALCARYGVSNRERTLHGALLDAQILAEVYLAMTGGQVGLAFGAESHPTATDAQPVSANLALTKRPAVIRADGDELAAHRAFVERLQEASGGHCLWPGESVS